MRHAARALAVLVLATTAALAQRDHGPPPSPLAQKCGSQIAWAASFEDAVNQAKQLKRPIFWYLATVPRSPMDRKPVIDLYMRAGPFSAPDVINALNRRFVPVMAPPTKSQVAQYKLAPLEFIEPGFLVLKPDGGEIGRLDRITTFHDLWFVGVLNKILEGQTELGRPSDAVTKAAEPTQNVEEMLLDGTWQKALDSPKPESAPTANLQYLYGRLGARLGIADEARKLLTAAKTPESQVELGLLALREEKWAEAEATLAKVTGGTREAEARYLRGVALFRMNRQPEADALWKEIAASSTGSPWAAKAAAEVERYGPFSRGFEEYGYLPPEAIPAKAKDLAGTMRPREPKDAEWLVRRSVRYLLERQNPDGSWDDSNYDFGGRDSLPDVYVAVTALCASALLDWSSVEPERAKAAIEKAAAYLTDESHVVQGGNKQERVWAHSYRALFFTKLAAGSGPLAEGAKAKLKDVVKRLQDLQMQNGQFAHEYPNPFATATALHALKTAETGGVVTPASVVNGSAAALRGARGEDGTYSYGFTKSGKGGSKDVDASGGRMPTCELALFLCGQSSQAKLVAAIETSHQRHAALEAVRKYDDHAPPHGIGGFFFWYDVYGRALAIDALSDQAKKRALFDQERRGICGIAEIDGRFVDSHELGKPYGTAMGLLSLKLATEKSP
jgi:hypothetical protein